MVGIKTLGILPRDNEIPSIESIPQGDKLTFKIVKNKYFLPNHTRKNCEKIQLGDSLLE